MKKWAALFFSSLLFAAAAIIALRTDPVTWAGMTGMLCGAVLFGSVGFGIGWFTRGVRERQTMTYNPPPPSASSPPQIIMLPNAASFGWGRERPEIEMLPAGPRQFSVIGDDDA